MIRRLQSGQNQDQAGALLLGRGGRRRSRSNMPTRSRHSTGGMRLIWDQTVITGRACGLAMSPNTLVDRRGTDRSEEFLCQLSRGCLSLTISVSWREGAGSCELTYWLF